MRRVVRSEGACGIESYSSVPPKLSDAFRGEGFFADRALAAWRERRDLDSTEPGVAAKWRLFCGVDEEERSGENGLGWVA